MPPSFHQDVLRSANVQEALIAGLRINYNLSFMGSICTSEDKVKSRALLVATMRQVVNALVAFVKDNPANQAAIFAHLPDLRRHLGKLKLPAAWPNDFGQAHVAQIPEEPGLGVERLVVECLRGNKKLCEAAVPRELIEEFGALVDAAPDPSTCPALELFHILCVPAAGVRPLRRNQELVLEVLLSKDLTNIRGGLEHLFFKHGQAVVAPEQLVLLLSKCISGHNIKCASILQVRHYSIDNTLVALATVAGLGATLGRVGSPDTSLSVTAGGGSNGLAPLGSLGKIGESSDDEMDEATRLLLEAAGPPDPPTRGNTLNGGGAQDNGRASLEAALVAFLANQLESLVVDPKLFRLETTWALLCITIKQSLAVHAGLARDPTPPPSRGVDPSRGLAHLQKCSFSSNGSGGGGGGWRRSKAEQEAALAACQVARCMLDGARSLGLEELEEAHVNALRLDQDSLLVSAKELYANAPAASDLMVAAGRLARTVDPATVLRSRSIGGENNGEHPLSPRGESEARAGTKGMGGQNANRRKSKADLKKIAAAAQKKAEKEAKVEKSLGLAAAPGDHKFIQEVNDKIADSPVPGCSRALGMFHESLVNNPRVKNKLESRKFELVKILENAADLTGKRGVMNGVLGAGAVGSVAISWDDICSRFVKFSAAHNFDKDESTTLRIFRIFRSHLVKARSNADGTPIEHMNEEQEAHYEECQRALAERGVAEVVVNAIATHAPNVEGNLADEGIELLMEMMSGGGVDAVQSVLIHFVNEKDRENKFLLHLKARVDHHITMIKERKNQTCDEFVPLSAEQRGYFKNANQTLFMLCQMCEGHNLVSQNLLRSQPLHATKVNLVDAVCHVLVAQTDTAEMLVNMEQTEIRLVIGSLEFAIEMLQGPCHANQELAVRVDGFVSSLEKIVESNFSSRVSPSMRLEIKTKALIVIAALIEGRNDLKVHTILASQLQPAMFELFRKKLNPMLERSAGKIYGEAWAKLESHSLDALSKVKTLYNDLRTVSVFNEKLVEIELQRKKMEKDMLDSDIVDLEVQWKDRIEVASFPVPKDSKYLTLKTKNEFLANADLATSEKRMKQLIADAPTFMAEMQQVYLLSERYPSYGWLNQNLTMYKWFQYGLVVILNLNILMASFGEGVPKGYTSIVDGIFRDGLASPVYAPALYTSAVLGVINGIGYLVMMVFSTMTEVPIIVRKLDEYTLQCYESVNLKEEDFRDPGAFTYWGATLIMNAAFSYMHFMNFPDNRGATLQIAVLFGINLPWTLTCVRNYIVVPDTPAARMFCIVYDTLVSKPFFRNQVLLLCFSINGFFESRYFTLMLLDVMNNSAVLANVIRSVSDSAVCLAWVFYLFVVTVIIYAAFGLHSFRDDFMTIPTDDDGYSNCNSVISCFFLIFYQAVPNGMLTATVLTNVDNSRPDFLARVLFDLSFFIWVGVLLFNIITGLMVDGFGALREADDEKADILENQCFVCGFSRNTYDDLPNFKGPSFDHHKQVEHEFWKYVYFYVYLKRKSKSDFSGVESYVWEMIASADTGWVPVRNSAAIQAAAAFVPEDQEGVTKEDYERMESELAKVSASNEHLARELARVLEHLGE